MRHSSPKVRALLMHPDVYRNRFGGPAICHLCQRSMVHYGGMASLMVRDMKMVVAGASWWLALSKQRAREEKFQHFPA